MSDKISENQMNENIQKEEAPEIAHTTQQITDIIAQNELIEKAKRDKIISIISKQEKILRKKEAELDKQLIELNLLEKKARLTKKALKKAKELKLGRDKITLIQLDVKQTKALRKTNKELTEQIQTDIKNMKALIALLETIV